MDFKIREIQKNDFEDLISMFKEFATFQKMPDKMVNTAELMNQESHYLNGFVIEDELTGLVGYVTYFYAYYTWIGKSMYMDDLYVKPEYRGKGLGRELIQSVLDKAKEDNCKKLRWQVSGWNKKAIDFYKKLGAFVDGTELNCDYWFIEI